MELIMHNFGFSREKYDLRIEKIKKNNPKAAEKMINKENAFEKWYFDSVKGQLLDRITEAEKHLVIGNSIYITSLLDYDDRRYHFTEAIGILHSLSVQLKNIIDTVPVDVNKYTRFGNQIDLIIKMIKGLKKSDNKVRKSILNKRKSFNNKTEDDYNGFDIIPKNEMVVNTHE